jgi:polygalacturonase
MNRRQIMTSLAGLASVAAVESHAFAATPRAATVGSLPVFDPRKMGVIGDGKTLDSAAINQAITLCSAARGGIVYLSPGTYLCETVILKSNVTLYLEAGATILGSPRIADYNPKHLIYARNAENVSLTGPGCVDGQGHTFWVPSGRSPVAPDQEWSDAIHIDWKYNERPEPMVQFHAVTNLRLEGVRLQGAAGWTMRPFNCNHVVLHGISIKNPVYGTNSDGVDITGCQNVLMSDCVVDTGDDGIRIKSEDVDGDACNTTKNIVVTNCIVTGCCNGFKIGTKTENGFENITFSNSVLFNDDVPFGSRLNAGIPLEMVDGGWIDGVVLTGIKMRRARAPLHIRLEDVHRADFFAIAAPPKPNFMLRNVTDLRILWSRAAKDTTLAVASDQTL